jgi:hypothetical protein
MADLNRWRQGARLGAQRFLLAKTADQGPQEISIMLNWTAELEPKAPAGK